MQILFSFCSSDNIFFPTLHFEIPQYYFESKSDPPLVGCWRVKGPLRLFSLQDVSLCFMNCQSVSARVLFFCLCYGSLLHSSPCQSISVSNQTFTPSLAHSFLDTLARLVFVSLILIMIFCSVFTQPVNMNVATRR